MHHTSSSPLAVLNDADAAEAGKVMGRAFQDDPVNAYVLPDAAQRSGRFPAVYTAFLRYGLRVGQVSVTAGPIRAAAIWMPPDHKTMRLDLMVAVGLHHLPDMLGAGGADRLVRFIRHLETTHHSILGAPHWYLMLLGVDPPFQGQGLGSVLLKPGLERADAAGVPCYVETANARNLPFYQKAGFELVAENLEPESQLRFWSFVRKPR